MGRVVVNVITGETSIDPTDAPSFETAADVLARVRAARDERLRESNFDVVRLFLGENLPVPREWRDYRQSLRDLPQQANPSVPIIWPGKPGT